MERGFTRRRVATELGVTERQIWRWERGESPVKRLHLLALAGVYGVPVETLGNGREEA